MINKKHRIIFCLVFLWALHITTTGSDSISENALSPSSKIQGQDENSIFEYLDKDWDSCNGDLLLYKDQGVLLTGANFVGKSSLAYVVHGSPNWQVVSPSLTYFRLAISKINKVLLIGKAPSRRFTIIHSRLFGDKEIKLITEDPVIIKWIVMFDDSFQKDLDLWKWFKLSSRIATVNPVNLENLDVRLIQVKERPWNRKGYEALLKRILGEIDSVLGPIDSILQAAL